MQGGIMISSLEKDPQAGISVESAAGIREEIRNQVEKVLGSQHASYISEENIAAQLYL